MFEHVNQEVVGKAIKDRNFNKLMETLYPQHPYNGFVSKLLTDLEYIRRNIHGHGETRQWHLRREEDKEQANSVMLSMEKHYDDSLGSFPLVKAQIIECFRTTARLLKFAEMTQPDTSHPYSFWISLAPEEALTGAERLRRQFSNDELSQDVLKQKSNRLLIHFREPVKKTEPAA